MKHDQYDDDLNQVDIEDDEAELELDDTDDTEDERHVVPDGGRVRVPIQFLDAERKKMLREKYPSHRPGFRYADADDDSDARDAAETARDEYVKFLQDAHRQPDTTSDLSAQAARPRSLADAKREAELAYEERSAWLRNAHKGQP